MFAKALKAELVLSPAVHRLSFEAKTKWEGAPAASMFDVDAVTDYWINNGVYIHVVN